MIPALIVGALAVPIIVIAYAAGVTRARGAAQQYALLAAGLEHECNELHGMYSDATDKWVDAALALDIVNRRLADCMCGLRLTQQQEAYVFQILSDASVVDGIDD